MSALCDMITFDFVVSLILNVHWYLSSLACLANRVSIFMFFFEQSGQPENLQLLSPIILGWILLSLILYMSELMHKEYFIASEMSL